jgi:carboxyl-terminal processing protease
MSTEISDNRSKSDNTLTSQLLHDSLTDTPRQTALQVLRGTAVAGLRVTGDTPGAAKAPASAPTVEQHKARIACGASPDYRSIMDDYFHYAYDVPTKAQRDKLAHGLKCDIKSKDDIIKTADKALRSSGDPYNHMFTPEQYKDTKMQTSGHFGGVGLELTTAKIDKDGKPLLANTNAEAAENAKRDLTDSEPVVLNPLPDTPAAKAGFKRGDIITHITSDQGSFDTRHMKFEDAVDKIRGPVGSTVHIAVERDGQPLERDLVREDIKVKTVDEPKQLPNDITYIKLNSFGEQTERELAEAMLKFKDTKAFIVDVRNNGGGLVDTSVDSAELFIKKGAIMTEKDREDSVPNKPQYSKNTYLLTDKTVYSPAFGDIWMDVPRLPYLAGGKPIAVLTNGGTASGAEIFTGALHDTAHAATVGEKTYGKGIGQVRIPGPFDSGMSVTELHYLTPSGKWPGDANKHRIGLKPDYKIVNPKHTEFGTATDLQLNKAIQVVTEKMKAQHKPAPKKQKP